MSLLVLAELPNGTEYRDEIGPRLVFTSVLDFCADFLAKSMCASFALLLRPGSMLAKA